MTVKAGGFPHSLTIVVPAFNEGENLPRVVPGMVEVLRRTCPRGEVLIIDDGSKDSTAAGATALAERYPEVRVLTHEVNRGLTAALRTGFFGALTDFVTFLPADGQIDPNELDKMFAVFADHDLVLTTYRKRPDGPLRQVMSRTVRVMLQVAVGLRDKLEGAYLFRRALLAELDLVSRRSAGSVGLEIAAKARALGKRITSTEIECLPRLSGRSKVANLKNIAQYVDEIWQIRRSMKRSNLI